MHSIPGSELSLGDLILACARGGDAAAWREFIAKAHPVIAAMVIRTLRPAAEFSKELADDLIQETYLRICNSGALKTFQADDPKAIYGLLQSIAYSVVQDYYRSARARKRGGGMVHVSIDHPEQSPDSSGKERMERDVLLREVGECIEQIAPEGRDRNIFWLYYRHGLTSEAIARLPGIGLSSKGVESVLHRLTREVRRQMFPAAVPAGPSPKGSGG